MSFEGDPGCCLTCEEAHPGCLCYDCKCRRCSMYEYDPSEGKGRCAVARDEWKSWPTWEDYEHEAERVRLRAIERYGSVPTSLVARFSNGTVERKISYASAADLPHKIRVKLKPAERNTNHPEWRYVTVLLKTVEVTV